MLRLTTVIINLGVASNFISLAYRNRYKIQGIVKLKTIPIIGLNGESLRLGITHESGLLLIVIGDYFEVINFNITPLEEYDIILGVP
jgi:hypothetical protein